MEIHYHGVILGEPKAQARHRHFSRGKFTQTYDPSSEKKGSFASVIQENAPNEPWNFPLLLELNFYMSRPKSHYKVGKNAGELKPNAPEWHSNKPDIDNLIKFVQDALNKVFYHDDSCICQIYARKMYSARPRTEITIKSLL